MVTKNITLNPIFRKFEDQAKDSSVSDDELRDELSKFLQNAGYERTPYRLQVPAVFRARKGQFNSIEEACLEFKNVKSLSAPPDDLAKDSRCNMKGHSVFYCSSENGIPIFEVRPEKGDYVATASFWPKQGDITELVLPIIGVRELREGLAQHDKRDSFFKMLENDMQYKSTHSQVLDIDNRLSEWFVTPVNKSNQYIYRLTTAYYNGLLKYAQAGDNRVNSLIYPSVEGRISGHNIVIEKDFVESNLQAHWTTIHKVENVIGETLFLRPKKQLKQVKANGDIIWENAQNSDKLWALSPKSRIVSGPPHEAIKKINRFGRYLDQLPLHDRLGF